MADETGGCLPMLLTHRDPAHAQELKKKEMEELEALLGGMGIAAPGAPAETEEQVESKRKKKMEKKKAQEGEGGAKEASAEAAAAAPEPADDDEEEDNGEVLDPAAVSFPRGRVASRRMAHSLMRWPATA
jgi:hypothetical protein